MLLPPEIWEKIASPEHFPILVRVSAELRAIFFPKLIQLLSMRGDDFARNIAVFKSLRAQKCLSDELLAHYASFDVITCMKPEFVRFILKKRITRLYADIVMRSFCFPWSAHVLTRKTDPAFIRLLKARNFPEYKKFVFYEIFKSDYVSIIRFRRADMYEFLTRTWDCDLLAQSAAKYGNFDFLHRIAPHLRDNALSAVISIARERKYVDIELYAHIHLRR